MLQSILCYLLALQCKNPKNEQSPFRVLDQAVFPPSNYTDEPHHVPLQVWESQEAPPTAARLEAIYLLLLLTAEVHSPLFMLCFYLGFFLYWLFFF